MAQFPLQDKKDILDAVNYVLSGPSGLGQDFGSFNSNGQSYSDVTGSNRTPYTVANTNNAPYSTPIPNVNLYTAPIALSLSEMLDEFTYKFTFASAQPTAPFVNGQAIRIEGVGSPYNGNYTVIGVIDCTTTYVKVRYQDPITVAAPVASAGTVSWSMMGRGMSTDCNAFVTVVSNSAKVVTSLQLNNTIFYKAFSPGTFTYDCYITRYRGYPNQSAPGSIQAPGFYFDVDEPNPNDASPYIAQRQVTITVPAAGTYSVHKEDIFASVIDEPGPGYYWYLNDIAFADITGSLQATSITGSNTLVFPRNHGLVANQEIVYISDDANGLIENTVYFVRAVGLTVNQCQVSTSSGGSAVALTDGTKLKLNFTKLPLATSITGGNTLVFPSAHGFIAGQRIYYNGDTQNGLTGSTYYYVSATGLTTTDCQVSLTPGGASVALTNGTTLKLAFTNYPIEVTNCVLSQRSFSLQVVKP